MTVLPLYRLAARLRLPAGWLRQEAMAGRLPCLRIGRRLLFNKEAVERALADRAASSREAAHA
jgi:excisionase family DNA binding protein